MGGAPSINPLSITFFPFFSMIVVTFTTTLILFASAEENESRENRAIHSLEDDNGATTSPPPPISSTGSQGGSTAQQGSSDDVEKKSVTLKPSTVVILGVLAFAFSISLFILFYIKHCNKANMFSSNVNNNGESRLQERKNSGVERTIVESLPVFKFESLRGQKQGLECAVCLNGFEDHEILRLLPKCKHAFHIECVDTWLEGHSTCPLCRDKIDPNDSVPLHVEGEQSLSDIERGTIINNSNNSINNNNNNNDNLSQTVSSVGDRNSGLLNISVLKNGETSSFTRSLNSSSSYSSRNVRSECVIGEHRLDHRIILSPTYSLSGANQRHQQRSNFEPCDTLYLTPDMIITEGSSSQLNGRRRTTVENNRDVIDDELENGFGEKSKGNLRTTSEMTGMMRFLSIDRDKAMTEPRSLRSLSKKS